LTTIWGLACLFWPNWVKGSFSFLFQRHDWNFESIVLLECKKWKFSTEAGHFSNILNLNRIVSLLLSNYLIFLLKGSHYLNLRIFMKVHNTNKDFRRFAFVFLLILRGNLLGGFVVAISLCCLKVVLKFWQKFPSKVNFSKSNK
jgi:hypothetical protein